MFCFKMAANERNFFLAKTSHVIKIWKITFPKEFVNKIWLEVEKHEYIYIFEITFHTHTKKNALQWRPKTSFVILSNKSDLC